MAVLICVSRSVMPLNMDWSFANCAAVSVFPTRLAKPWMMPGIVGARVPINERPKDIHVITAAPQEESPTATAAYRPIAIPRNLRLSICYLLKDTTIFQPDYISIFMVGADFHDL